MAAISPEIAGIALSQLQTVANTSKHQRSLGYVSCMRKYDLGDCTLLPPKKKHLCKY